jgi:hypothetical protein
MVVLIASIAFIIATPPARAQHCEIVDCWTAECWWVGPNHRRCRRVCRHRCWHPPPAYDPEPHHAAESDPEPHYAAPSHTPVSTAGSDPRQALLLLGGVGIIVVLIVFTLVSTKSATEDLDSATNETERDTAETRALIGKLEAAARDADSHLHRFLADTRHPRR